MSEGPQLFPLACLGLEALCSGDMIRRRASELAMRARLMSGAAALDDRSRQAGEVLADPRSLLTESARWFVLPQGSLRERGFDPERIVADAEALRGLVQQISPDDSRAHNLAVLACFEASTASSYGTLPAAVDAVATAQAAVSSGPRFFWMRFEAKASEIDDPRVDAAFLRQLREGYAERMLGPILARAAAGFEAMPEAELKRALLALERCDRDAAPRSPCREMLLGPACERVTFAVKANRERVDGCKTRAAMTEIERDLVGRVDEVVNLLVAAGNLAGPQGLRVRDDYAELLRLLAVRIVNDFDDYVGAEPLLSRAENVAAGAPLVAQIERDAKVVRKSVLLSKCVYCRVRAANGSFAGVSLYLVTDWSFLRQVKRYKSLVASVPRCKDCESRHESNNKTMTAVGWSAAVVVALVALVIGMSVFKNFPGACVIAGMVGFAGWFVASLSVSLVQKAQGKLDVGSPRDFPPIADLLRTGWKFGDKPGKYG
jgi:hypothetical protein